MGKTEVTTNHTNRWDELAKQPEAKWIKVYDQYDDFDRKGHTFLVSPRRTRDFDHFVDDVNNTLSPGVPLRKIYTAAGGTEVRSLSALNPNKEYTASPKRFIKKKTPPNSRKHSKKPRA